MGVDIKINPRGMAALKKQVNSNLGKRLQKIGSYMRGRIVRKISEPTRSQGPSAPGDPPHADTGTLRQSIFWRYDSAAMKVTIGTTLLYGFWLEVGTYKMAARPYLRSTLEEEQGAIDRIAKTGRV